MDMDSNSSNPGLSGSGALTTTASKEHCLTNTQQQDLAKHDTLTSNFSSLLEKAEKVLAEFREASEAAQTTVSDSYVTCPSQLELDPALTSTKAQELVTSSPLQLPQLPSPVCLLDVCFADIDWRDVCEGNFRRIGSRSVQYFGLTDYRYGRTVHHAKPYPENSAIDRIISELSRNLNDPGFNKEHVTCLITKYENGNCHIPFHSDDEPEIVGDIVTVILGATRDLKFRSKSGPARQHSLSLQHGSAYVMVEGSQNLWEHGILPQPDTRDCRVSLTFRRLAKSPPASSQSKIPRIHEPKKPRDDPNQYPNERVLFLTDSMLRDSLPDTFSAHMHCVKREMYKLTDISDHEMYMYGTKFVFISAGINDLSRYDHRNYSLAADFKAKIDILCRKYPDTTFIFNALLLTKFGWLNREINLFNRHIFDHYSLRRNNLWFFDSHHICCKLGEGGHPILEETGNGIHIASLPKREITRCLKSNYIGDRLDTDEIDFNPWQNISNNLNNCKYYKIDEIKPSKDYELKVFSLNVRSLAGKIDEFRENIEIYTKYDVLCFNETNCDATELPFKGKELELDGFHPPLIQAPARESNRGGGLAIYVNKKLCETNDVNLKIDLCSHDNSKTGEIQVVEITFNGQKNALICNLYRSPSGDTKGFLEKLDTLAQKLTRHKNKNICLVGDTNINLLDYGKNDAVTRYVDSLAQFGFAPVISPPTRITDHSATVIDHIFVNNCHAVTKSGVTTESISDHLATFVTIIIDQRRLNCKLSKEDPIEAAVRVINEENLKCFEEEISATDWNFINAHETADEKFNAFENKYSEIYQKNFPKAQSKNKKPGSRKNSKPWMMDWLQCACDRKNRLYHKFVKTPTTENDEKYKKMKAFTEKHVDKAKREYYAKFLKKYSGDCKMQWRMENSILNRTKNAKENIKKLNFRESEVTDSQQIANIFNDYFCNVAENLKQENGLARSADQVTRTETTDSRCRKSMQLEDSSPSEIIEIVKESAPGTHTEHTSFISKSFVTIR
ncbi:hypothetical protein ACHWQZ_G001240 [Mnemiopsis leidyi]